MISKINEFLYGLGGCDNESRGNVISCLGKKITAIHFQSGVNAYYGRLSLKFEDSKILEIGDDYSPSCCDEYRYMTCDDDVDKFVGATLLDIELRDGGELPDENGEHEVLFLEIKTSAGSFQCCTHNEHNGYYGGFSIKAEIKTIVELKENE